MNAAERKTMLRKAHGAWVSAVKTRRRMQEIARTYPLLVGYDKLAERAAQLAEDAADLDNLARDVAAMFDYGEALLGTKAPADGTITNRAEIHPS